MKIIPQSGIQVRVDLGSNFTNCNDLVVIFKVLILTENSMNKIRNWGTNSELLYIDWFINIQNTDTLITTKWSPIDTHHNSFNTQNVTQNSPVSPDSPHPQ